MAVAAMAPVAMAWQLVLGVCGYVCMCSSGQPMGMTSESDLLFHIDVYIYMCMYCLMWRYTCRDVLKAGVCVHLILV